MTKSFGPENPFQHNPDSEGFSDLSKAYKANPSIALYVKLRRKYPKAKIEVATSHAIDWVLSNQSALEAFDIPPIVVVGCLDADPSSIQELSLLLMENLIQRDAIEADGGVHVQSRDDTMADSLINYLIAMMLDALDWNDELHIPRDLIVLIKHQFGADVSIEKTKQEVREKRSSALWLSAQCRADKNPISIRELAKLMKVNPSTVIRWFSDGDYEKEVQELAERLDSDSHREIMELGRELKEQRETEK